MRVKCCLMIRICEKEICVQQTETTDDVKRFPNARLKPAQNGGWGFRRAMYHGPSCFLTPPSPSFFYWTSACVARLPNASRRPHSSWWRRYPWTCFLTPNTVNWLCCSRETRSLWTRTSSTSGTTELDQAEICTKPSTKELEHTQPWQCHKKDYTRVSKCVSKSESETKILGSAGILIFTNPLAIKPHKMWNFQVVGDHFWFWKVVHRLLSFWECCLLCLIEVHKSDRTSIKDCSKSLRGPTVKNGPHTACT